MQLESKLHNNPIMPSTVMLATYSWGGYPHISMMAVPFSLVLHLVEAKTSTLNLIGR